MNVYEKFVLEYIRVIEEARKNLDSVIDSNYAYCGNNTNNNVRTALIFSPHPDDECIIGALPLRLKNEAQFRIVNVPVTLGSNKSRRPARMSELMNACRVLGFDVHVPHNNGFDNVYRHTRSNNMTRWDSMVSSVAEIIKLYSPEVIFLPHGNDWHETHCGTHDLVMDALQLMGSFECVLVFTEYWRQMDQPSLLIESSYHDVACLVAGLACHVGEVARNPYHVSLLGWMHDNVRRGSEMVGGIGAMASNFKFGTLYGVKKWRDGSLVFSLDKRIVGQAVCPWPIV